MKKSGLILIPLFCCCSLLFAAVGGAAPKKTEPAVAPALFQNHRSTAPATDLLPSLRSRLPVHLNVSLPAGLNNHVPGGQPHLGAPEVSNRAPVKHASMQSPTPKSRFTTLSGGEDFGTATPIAALPYSDSSNTCSNIDDYTPICGAAGAPDVVYSYTPAADGCITISLCGSDYDTEIHVVDGTLPDIACNDDFCGLQSTIPSLGVIAGHTYYIIVDGYGSNCGNYRLLVDACPPPPPGVECPPDAVAEGEPICGPDYVDSFNGGCNSFPEMYSEIPCGTDSVKICGGYGTYLYQGGNYRDTDWYRITVDNTTTFHWCVTGQYATAMYLVDGRAGCGGATTIDLAFADPGQTACLNTVVGGGTYYLVVAPNTFTDVPCGSNYYMTFVVDSCPAPPPPPECPPNAIAEGEPVCADEYVDNYDGGCNSSPEAYVDIPCTPGTTTYCGTYGTYLFTGLNYRDTDWYRIVVNRTSTVSFDVHGQYGTSIYLLDGRFGCGGISVICANTGSPGQTIACSAQVGPGTYYIFVGTSSFAGDACGGLYVMNVTRDSCPEPFVLTCPPGAKPEGEPICSDEYNDNFNAGCNSDPPTFSNPYGGGTGNRNCVPGTVYVCGTYGTYINQGLNYRDTDWYQVQISGNTHLKYCAVGEAPTTIFLLNGTAGCNGLSVVCSNSGAPGDTVCCEADLTPGTYWLFVGTSDFVGTPCGSRYVISITQGDCPEPVRITCPPTAIPEGEPVCDNLYVDNYNGGCNSNPPVFTPMPCVNGTVQYCGTYGTYNFQGSEYRDTDWYQMPLADPQHISFCVVGEAATSIFILNAEAGCGTITIVSSATGAAGDTVCCTADLPPGMYWLFVATTDFNGVTCGSKYVATVYGYACTGPTAVAVSNLHALNQRGSVDVRWNAQLDPGTEFQVLRGTSQEGPFTEVGESVTSIGGGEFSMIDRSIQPSTAYVYRINYRQSGSWQLAGFVRIVTPEGQLAINAIRPNPTSGRTRIDYELPRAGNLRLEIFDVTGHKVRMLANSHAAAGTGTVVWDGRNDRGRELPGGAYFVRVAMDSKVVTRQVVLVR